jgi:hypothetical protein
LKAALTAIVDFIKGEPVIIVQAIPVLVAIAAAAGLKLSPEDVGKAVAIAEAIAVILARQNVTPVADLPPAPKAPAA